ncbi:MAG: ATP-binding protein [Burkholderiaceae bacterium]
MTADPVLAGGALPAPSPDTQWLSLRRMAVSRLVVALALALMAGASQTNQSWLTDARLFGWTAALYLVAAIVHLGSVGWLRPRVHPLLAIHVATDLFALTLMLHSAGGLRAVFGILIITAVTLAAVLSTRLMAASFAAAASLLLLGEAMLSWLEAGGGQAGLPMTAGLTGAACFVTALLVNWLARQLERQEAIARERGEHLRNQFAVTRQVVAGLEQGVLVLSPAGRIRVINRAARELLGLEAGADHMALAIDGDADLPALAQAQAGLGARAMLRAFEAWRDAGARGGERCELLLPGVVPTRVSLRFVSAPGRDTLVTIEDLRQAEAQAQQLKLASMGRLSASIAHEIRNPLGAIRHANALLGEQLREPAQQRLSGIIEANTLRIDRVVADVLSLARRESPNDEAVDAGAFLPAFIDEFVVQTGAAPGRVVASVETDRLLHFDSSHLQRVLVNLVANALRYASGQPAAVKISWRALAADRLELRISDDGPGLSPEMQQQAFEPFSTTEARGTGLGLFLSRELCAANGAAIRYEPPTAGRPGAFVIEPAAGGG